MTELFDATPMPDDPRYWDALAERVAARARGDRSARSARSIHWLAKPRARLIAASLVLTAALAAATLGRGADVPQRLATDWALALAPDDGLARALVVRDDPPAVAALLLDERGKL